ncbi:DUF2388 domain-containing protein [Pseudomonas sp. GCM10022188]|uniref:DUF2388 domain-containing protein n=1 Tax=Pseudomonas TaxID=286 RepID=UPI001E2F62F6|nr:DUF2388 domain-containing protein [Pseudomonas oryzagri]MCC6075020.1 DUF2388 domain-containing protein [Pseudomonas oryzagri]
MRCTLLFASLVVLPVASAMADHRGHSDEHVDWGQIATSAGISASLYSTFKDDKIVVAAQDDASSFIASGGAIRGAYLEAALQQIRQQRPDLQASDEQLAGAILADNADAAVR